MIWRSIRQSCLQSTCGLTNTNRNVTARHLSSISISNPSIATILATSSTDKQQTTTVVGSVRSVRKQKHHSFVELGDGSTTQSLQALLKPWQADGLSTGTSVAISGVWQPAPKGKEQANELQAEEVRIIGTADPERYPIQKKYHTAEYLRTLPHLRLRTPLNALLARMRSECDFHLSKYFRDQGFVRLQPPIITSSDCEGAGEVFTVAHNISSTTPGKSAQDPQAEDQTFFRSPKFLTVSSQLHLEAFINEHPKVWTLSPTFRAEKSDTPRHVSEFWMLEVEIRTESLEEVMTFVEDMIRVMTLGLKNAAFIQELVRARFSKDDRCGSMQTADAIEHRWKSLLGTSWPRITYRAAIHRLQEAVRSNQRNFQYAPSWSSGLHLEHERFIAEEIGQGSPVFVTEYPKEMKPFYMLPSSTHDVDQTNLKKTVACFDLLLPETCEVAGGSLREHRLRELTQSMRDRGLNFRQPYTTEPDGNNAVSSSAESGNLDWYVDLRRYGSVPHGGFGLGFDRLLGYLTDITNIKDVAPWPRYHGRCDC